MNTTVTFETCHREYLNRAGIKSAHTLAAYSRSIDLFFIFLADHNQPSLLPIHHFPVVPQQRSPINFTAEDTPIFLRFAEWLMLPSSGGGDKRPYAIATVELRVAGIQHWFQFLETQQWLPADFSLVEANRLVRNHLKPRHEAIKKAVSPIANLEPVIYYYDTQQPPKALLKSDTAPDRLERWELIRLRNCALLHCLAESGGRISELLGLGLNALAGIQARGADGLNVAIMGKGGHVYQVKFKTSLAALRGYLTKRNLDLNGLNDLQDALFVSHDPRYEGSRMSRIVAWRVVRRAARAFGLSDVSPQDFRHWRAMQLIQGGRPLREVQDLLGHRSIESIRALYAQVEPQSDVKSNE